MSIDKVPKSIELHYCHVYETLYELSCRPRMVPGLTLSIQLGAGHRSPCQCGVRLAQLMQDKSYDKYL